MDQRDPMPSIETWGASADEARDLGELDAAIYENPGIYGPAATAVAENKPIGDLPEPQKAAAKHIAKVLDVAGNRISFDTETEDKIGQDSREQTLAKQLRNEKDPKRREMLRRQFSSYRLGSYANKVVTDFLAIAA